MQRQYPGINVLHQGTQMGGRRFMVSVTIDEILPYEDMLMAIVDRLASVVHLADDLMGALLLQGQNDWTMSGVLINPHGTIILNNEQRTEMGVRGSTNRFNTRRQIQLELAPALKRAIESLLTSDTTILLTDLVLELRFDRPHVPYVARGRMRSYVKKTIASDEHTRGLAKYRSEDGLCGYQAVVYALTADFEMRRRWLGDLTWFTAEFGQGKEPSLQKLRESKKRFTTLGKALCRYLYDDDDAHHDWTMTLDATSTTSLLVGKQPWLQVLIVNEVTRQVFDFKRGPLFDPTHAGHSTIMLSYTVGHLQLITGPFEYFGKTFNVGNVYCKCCFRFQTTAQHRCADFEYTQCDKCLVKFVTAEHQKKHCQWDFAGEQCYRCDKIFYNATCLESHQCRAKDVEVCGQCRKKIYPYTEHRCGMYKCATCSQEVGEEHRCSIQTLTEPEQQTPEEAGSQYYAFDIEAMLLATDDHAHKHVVNLVVVRKCFTGEEFMFHSMVDFVKWMEEASEVRTLFAHNLKGYDGRMVFDYLFDHHTPPQNVLWQGSKIMSMQYGKIKFQDTLLHLPASLAQLPKMFGLDEYQFKKGFFPYRFNTEENQNYVGPIPAQDYFEPEQMPSKKRAEFLKWYSEWPVTQLYRFKQELVDYCVSDTRILAKAIEAYMREQMAEHPVNPFSRLTIASYAMMIYRTYYMPAESLARLSAVQEEEIALSMHGGRTDTRCMLREWSEEELKNGLCGRYQDVQSLYPTVQFYDPLPVGAPRRTHILTGDPLMTTEQLKQIFGFVCCDIEPTRYMHHPILVDFNETTGRLMADLLPKTKLVVPTPELHLALDHGYVVTKVYWYYEFDSSTELFKPYFRKFLKAKLEASGVPDWVQSDTDWLEFERYHREELGIQLQRDLMQPNAAKKTGAKLLCNSLWGKFGERSRRHVWQMFRVGQEDDGIMRLENAWIDGDINISYRKYSGDNQSVGMIYTHTKQLPASHIYRRLERGHRNIALASMITSHARCRLWTELNKLGERVLYHDTDSIIYEYNPNLYNIPLGRYLGEWEDETDGDPIVQFVSTGPKCYSYTVRRADGSLKKDTKIKGITLHHDNAQLIGFDSMKALALGENDKIYTKCLTFKYDLLKGSMVTQNVIKQFKQTYEKGFINHKLRVFPFGWNLFPDCPEMQMTIA